MEKRKVRTGVFWVCAIGTYYKFKNLSKNISISIEVADGTNVVYKFATVNDKYYTIESEPVHDMNTYDLLLSSALDGKTDVLAQHLASVTTFKN